jgi:hypothetical protein
MWRASTRITGSAASDPVVAREAMFSFDVQRACFRNSTQLADEADNLRKRGGKAKG